MHDNLFTVAESRQLDRILADSSRPKTLEEVVGQEHILGVDGPLRRKMTRGRIGTVVLYGTTGIGKTSIAIAVGNTLGKNFVKMHGAGFKVAELHKVMDEAKFKKTLLFIDEVHRMTITQQDHLLEITEKGGIDLIAATSFNPNRAVSKALIDRGSIYELRPLTRAEIERVLRRGVAQLAVSGLTVTFDDDAFRSIAGRAGGSARRSLNILEDVIVGRPGDAVHVTKEMVDTTMLASPIAYDRDGDAHFDTMSAFAKSMRGGDADATAYWLAALLAGGEDPLYIARRLIVHASEDVGLADHTALQTANAAYTAVELIGMPEARIILAQAALHICRAPKSGSALAALTSAFEHIRENSVMPVPNHLRDTHFELAAKLGRGGYQSPHSSEAGWVDQVYAPGIKLGQFYRSDARAGQQTFEARADSFWEAVKGVVSPRRWRKA
jgi:putative ATPase